jgi:SAM-dependent methyltransferase
MTVKDLLRPVPGVKQFSLLRQRLRFTGSANYWERNYANGGTSGAGSYGTFAQAKAGFLNAFVREHGVRSVTEFGCGDGNQLSLAVYSRYVGLDVSPAAIDLCVRRFAADPTKSFFLYDGARFVDRAGLFGADLVLSLDVVYDLVEDSVFETYMTHLFTSSRMYVVVYATNSEVNGTAAHVLHRKFTPLAEEKFPQWRLAQLARGPKSEVGRADFFVYERLALDGR